MCNSIENTNVKLQFLATNHISLFSIPFYGNAKGTLITAPQSSF